MVNQTKHFNLCIIIRHDEPKIRQLCHQLDAKEISTTVFIDKNPMPNLSKSLKQADLLLLAHHKSTNYTNYIHDFKKCCLGLLVFYDTEHNVPAAITALESGADAYLPLNQSLGLTVSRISALLRIKKQFTGPSHATARVIKCGELLINESRREVCLKGQRLNLNGLQFELLHYFALHPGEIISRNELSQTLFNREFNGLDRTIDIHISHLRKCLNDSPSEPDYLKTIRGQGYLFLCL